MDPNTDDLKLLEAVKRVNPAFVGASEYFVLKDSIPHEVREAIEAMILRVKYIRMHQQWCMILTDWLSYKDQLIAILMTRMARRSLELGKRGPTADDLGNAPVCRQGFWDQWRSKLRESLAHLVGLIMRRAGGDASVALRVSFV
jgi:hypothetical protein